MISDPPAGAWIFNFFNLEGISGGCSPTPGWPNSEKTRTNPVVSWISWGCSRKEDWWGTPIPPFSRATAGCQPAVAFQILRGISKFHLPQYAGDSTGSSWGSWEYSLQGRVTFLRPRDGPGAALGPLLTTLGPLLTTLGPPWDHPGPPGPI